MVDFHSHILPGIDDGSESVEMSLRMLKESKQQGVDIIFATPHFYADENDPQTFLENRNKAYRALKTAIENSSCEYPEIMLGAEVLYFPGMSVAEELQGLTMGSTPCLLVEPPMMPWSDTMLDEIEQTGKNLKVIPVIAHIDRYMRLLDDDTLIDRVSGRKILIQVNASYFLHRDTYRSAVHNLVEDRFHFIGSDCHNLDTRAQNIGQAAECICKAGCAKELSEFNYRIYSFLGRV